jgi:hypothetical protein
MGSAGSKNDVDIYTAFEILLKETTGEILSVGSGFGVTEKNLDNRFNTNIITIDYLYENFNEPSDKSIVKMPMFFTVKEYISKRKSKDVSLIIDWPSPFSETYGIQAINVLYPKLILIRYASCGASGSSELQSFLGSCGCPSNKSGGCPSDKLSGINKLNGQYNPIYTYQTIIGTGSGLNGKTINVVVLKKISNLYFPDTSRNILRIEWKKNNSNLYLKDNYWERWMELNLKHLF